MHLLSWGGEGAPLLLTHGLAGNAHWWDQAAPLLLDRFQPVALDFSGHGESERVEAGGYGPELYIENMETVRRMLGWPKMAIAAHSMGARIAIDYAARYPDRVTGLVAVDFLPTSFKSKTNRFERLKIKRQPVYPDAESMVRRFHLEPDGTILPKEELARVARHCIRKVEGGYSWKFDWKAFFFQYDSVWKALAKIKAPTLIVRGEKSAVMTRGEMERVAGKIKGGKALELARAHHHVPLDAPRELAEAIARHLGA